MKDESAISKMTSASQICATKIFTFAAAHKIPGHKGKCKCLHGHTYKLEVSVRQNTKNGVYGNSSGISSAGMVIDFKDLSSLVNGLIIEKLDHVYLNDLFAFIPTTEQLGTWIFTELNKALAHPTEITKIRLWESDSSFVTIKAGEDYIERVL